ncbi:uncharacterized protein LOC109504166 [Harpegnathos saltator]|uniref:uncharacterized protein LOC109504166 n=1 Tax=Harpegnathos saltator TaxID=610380 RepID=UPI000DBEE067|nr:uncharacterized protein LOC109504166 [Harpegnathos saltator]
MWFIITANELLIIPDTLETRQFFNVRETNIYSESLDTESDSVLSLNTEVNTEANIDDVIIQNNNNSENYTTSSTVSDCTAARWTDANAVKALISNWKEHENDFKNHNIRNNKVWQMIADDLKKTNSLWNFTGTQCENIFKDVRKACTKVKDHNNESGAELKTCKFYDNMEVALGDKPIVKPISISSSLKKRVYPNVKRAISPCTSDTCDEKENVSLNKPQTNRKKSKVARELQKLSAQQSAVAEEREQAKMQRHREKMEKQDKTIAVRFKPEKIK